ncbi:App1 family protein [Aequorivita sediminis]|uniref:App1 family protein n=1 Tax=Aequorivita sediminis TaxID=3073653 RepID=UPI0028AECA3B|nr:phosphatase domain-containing protein [Aequorivita sp. F6058]
MFKKDPIQIVTFRSYGTANHLYAKGRSIQDEDIDLNQTGLFNLLRNSWKRFITDKVTSAKLTLTLPDNRTISTVTDSQGYFLIDETIENLLPLTDEEGWMPFSISFTENHTGRKIQKDNKFKGEILIPKNTAKYGVISDIDDTILHTGLTSRLKWAVIKNTFFKSAEKRIPLKGAADFYQKLHDGKSGNDCNPIFYVSHSPWNLYNYLEVFLEVNNFHKGPILLRDFVNPFAKKYKAEKPQKQTEIINILKTYPKLPFILIGDSGQHDPDIYQEITESYPGRILAIYLRDVNRKKKMERVKKLYKDYTRVPVLLVEDTEAAINHAKEQGFI